MQLKHIVLIVVSAIFLTGITVYAFMSAKPEAPAKAKEPKQAQVEKKEESKKDVPQSALPSMKEYDKIESGMSVSEAKQLLGEPSSETSYESGGRKNSTVMFNAAGDFGAYIMITTSDGKVVTKSQFGLK